MRRETNTQRHARLKAAGICTRCGKAAATRTRLCDACQLKQEEYTARGNWKRQGINITREEYQDRYESQRGKCAICGGGYTRNRLVVDHDHTTGEIRGLLCDRCNAMLGMAHDNAHTLRAAIRYLGE